MYKAIDIAKWFLNYNRYIMNTWDSEYMTNLKLNKLLYYSQGVYYAIQDKLLFDEDIFMQEYNPIIKSVYNKYSNTKEIVFDETYKDILDEETIKILKDVFFVFAQYTDWKLKEFIRQELWHIRIKNNIVDVKDMKKYFEKEYIEDDE